MPGGHYELMIYLSTNKLGQSIKTSCENKFYAYLSLLYDKRWSLLSCFKYKLKFRKKWNQSTSQQILRKAKKLKNVPHFSMKEKIEVLSSWIWTFSENHSNPILIMSAFQY